MRDGVWRWLWTASVFALFGFVVMAALEGAPPPDRELPTIAADPRPIKESRDLPPVDAVVSRSSVLNMLAEEDRAADMAAAATPALDEALARRVAEQRRIAELEAMLEQPAPGAAPTSDAEPADPTVAADGPALLPQRRPPGRQPTEAAPVERSEAPVQTAALPSGGFRIEIAAVTPGEEHATFDRLQARYAGVLGDLAPRFQVISGAAGVEVRVQAGPLNAEAEAEQRCRALRDAGGDCMVVAAPG